MKRWSQRGLKLLSQQGSHRSVSHTTRTQNVFHQVLWPNSCSQILMSRVNLLSGWTRRVRTAFHYLLGGPNVRAYQNQMEKLIAIIWTPELCKTIS